MKNHKRYIPYEVPRVMINDENILKLLESKEVLNIMDRLSIMTSIHVSVDLMLPKLNYKQLENLHEYLGKLYEDVVVLETDYLKDLNDRQLRFMQKLPEDFKWIVREANGSLYTFNTEPTKQCIDGYEFWHIDYDDILYCKFIPFKNIYPDVKWEDEKAWKFR